MLLNINFESDIPIYIQLKNEIIMGIAKKQIENGESLPSVRQLAEDIGINMHTVNKAYNMLKAEGFISMDRRKGAVVNTSGIIMDEKCIQEMVDGIRPYMAEAYCRGMTKEEFLKIAEEIYEDIPK